MRSPLRRYRRSLVVIIHLAMIALANVLAFTIRFDGAVPPAFAARMWETLPLVLAVRGVVFGALRLYQGLWRYTDIWDLRDIALGVAGSSMLLYALVVLMSGRAGYPRSVFVIDALLLLAMMVGVRMTRRLVSASGARRGARRVLVVGAGDAGEMVVRDMKRHADYEAVGFIDDDTAKVGVTIHGVRVLGTRQDLSAIAERLQPDEVLIAVRGGPTSTVARDVVRQLGSVSARITTLPSVGALMSRDSRVTQRHIRQVSIEDLLPRETVGLDPVPVSALLRDRVVMVTGAGGSIGAELCRQIAAMRPAALVLFERTESGLFAILNELADSHSDVETHGCIGDVADAGRLDEVLSTHRPSLLFHAAAHKHVPLMEANPCEAVKNNVRGTRLLSEAAEQYGVERFIFVSTDKAVNPTSVMGATKRVCEQIVGNRPHPSSAAFSIVRFGNVLGSSGSVLLRFAEQIRRGGPITVTHPEIERYFMLISEAAELVLHAAAAGASGATYVLDMGAQIKLVDLARTLIRLGGFAQDDIPIEYTGLRPGEKMFEELVGLGEAVEPSGIEKVWRITEGRTLSAEAWRPLVSELERHADAGRGSAVLEVLHDLEPTYAALPAHPVASPAPSTAPAPPASTRDDRETDGAECPHCGVAALKRSRTQTALGRLRRRFGTARPYRCHACGWRGWLEPIAERMTWLDTPGGRVSPDFQGIDSKVGSERPAVREENPGTSLRSTAPPWAPHAEPTASPPPRNDARG